MSNRSTDFRIGLFYPNSSSIHLLATVAKELNPDPLVIENHAALAAVAEEIGLDYLFIADAWGSRGPRSTELGLTDPAVFPPVLAAILFASTRSIKVITTMHLLWLHPLHVLRIGSNLDALSDGRWGMNVVTGAGFNEPLVQSVTAIRDHDERYQAASEAMELILGGWRNAGKIDFSGKFINAHGALVGPTAVQRPYPHIVSAGASSAGRAFAARYADTVFLPGRASKQLIDERVSEVRRLADEAGRDGQSIRALVHASVIVRESASEAQELAHRLREAVDETAVQEYLTEIQLITTYGDMLEKFSPDQVKDLGLTAGTTAMHGDPEHVADRIAEIRDELGADGVSLSFPISHPDEVRTFGRLVVPLLEERGLWSRAQARGCPW